MGRMRRALLAAGTAAVSSVLAERAGYDVQVVSRPAQPIISAMLGNSLWPQAFNPSFVGASAGTGFKSGLLVRAQNCSGWVPGQCVGCNVDSQHRIAPWFPGSVIGFAEELPGGGFGEPFLVFKPEAGAPVDETYGTEDPRIALDSATGVYHMFYTCYGTSGPFLCQATTTNPTAPYPGNWTRHGAVVPSYGVNSKSGALLVRPQPPHFLYWGAGVVHLALTDDFVTFTTINDSFIAVRPGSFDDNLVEAGPPPLPLSDGNLLFFYNSANNSDVAGAPFGAYNVGWTVINGSNPAQILARSDAPLLSPDHGWEQGTAPYECNVQNVTFLEAAAPVRGVPDAFDVYFGGSDAVVGTARVQVLLPTAV